MTDSMNARNLQKHPDADVDFSQAWIDSYNEYMEGGGDYAE